MRTKPFISTGSNVTAILGPTNTGKTHLALERMLAHKSGIIGLPLRLLAREIYNRICEKVGAHQVALITGEEKIDPPTAHYRVYTVEALPRHTNAAFAAIDEVQLASDLERGHVFTDRILHLRGTQETILLGAATMEPIIKQLLPSVNIVSRPRFSQLSYIGSKKIARLPRRSAIVAFASHEVYAIGELIKRQRGGVSVVTGAMSPRTRNAQVALYQSGDVDFLVATDAIGMGLNLDINHVAFAQRRKYDGYHYRDLTAAELAQIAGRAGRYTHNGSFGVTGRAQPLEPELATRIHEHNFSHISNLQWRTNNFDFSTLENLQRSLEKPPPTKGLTKALPAVDARALHILAHDVSITKLADTSERIKLLWDVCRLPDYRKIAPTQHADIVAHIYRDLVKYGSVNENYIRDEVARADKTQGDLDALSQRIAQIRTWTFVAHRSKWLTNQQHWQKKTREIEDRLSDALHESLTKRFIDRRTSFLIKRLRENTIMNAEISQTGHVLVEGHHVGNLDGFRFHADTSGEGADAKAVRAAANKILTGEYDSRAEKFAACANGDLSIASDGIVRWIGQPIASLTASEDLLKPRAILLADDQLMGAARDKVIERVERFVAFHFETALKPLFDLRQADALVGMTRGIAFQLIENLGILPRRQVAEDIKNLDQISRAALRRLGVRFGAFHIFLPMMLKPAPAQAITLLWALKNDAKDHAGYGEVVQILAAGRTSVVTTPHFEHKFYELAGYRILGRRAVRIDILERLADLIRTALHWDGHRHPRPDGAFDGQQFFVTPAMLSILGATPDDMEEILKNLGYCHQASDNMTIAKKLAATHQTEEADNKPTIKTPELVGARWTQADITAAKLSSDTATTSAALQTANHAQAANHAQTANQDSPAEQDESSASKVVLLWRYQRRSQQRSNNKDHHTANKRLPGQKRRGMPGQAVSHKNNDQKHGGKAQQKANASRAKPHAASKNKKPQKKPDAHSPFAALAALRDQLKK